MLPNPALKPWYDRVTWLFVSRNFKLDDKDKEALRTHDRFGISSWPQMIVFDPVDDRVLLDAPRDLAGFVKAFERATATTNGRAGGTVQTKAQHVLKDPVGADARSLGERLRDPNPIVRAIALEEIASAKEVAQEHLAEADAILGREGEDIVVVLRALRLLVKRKPATLVARTLALLAIDNDPLRYEVLELVATKPDPLLGPVLNRLFAEAGKAVASRNPNVLRMKVAPCLGAMGDAASVEVLAPLARAADWRNGTTKLVLDALRALAMRLPEQKERVEEILVASLPKALAAQDVQGTRGSLSLSEAVFKALAALRPGWKAPALPKGWSEAEREAVLAALR